MQSTLPFVGFHDHICNTLYLYGAFHFFQRRLEKHTEHNVKALKAIFKYCQGAAHVWDIHELGLAKQERALQEKLEDMRRRHDNTNQVRKKPLKFTLRYLFKTSLTYSLQTLVCRGTVSCLIPVSVFSCRPYKVSFLALSANHDN